jgi:hypothetical protein
MAQDGDESDGDEIIISTWSNPADCNRGNASHHAYSAFLARFQSLKGSCVAVEGYWYGGALFVTSRDAREDRSNVARRLRHRRIGLYARPELLETAPGEPERYLIVGRVGECETQWPDAMMVMGYCHYTGGPILLVSQAFKL